MCDKNTWPQATISFQTHTTLNYFNMYPLHIYCQIALIDLPVQGEESTLPFSCDGPHLAARDHPAGRKAQETTREGSVHVSSLLLFFTCHAQAWHSAPTHCTTCRLQLNTQIPALGMDNNCKWTAAEAKKQSFEGGVWVWAHLLPCSHEDPSEWFPQP